MKTKPPLNSKEVHQAMLDYLRPRGLTESDAETLGLEPLTAAELKRRYPDLTKHPGAGFIIPYHDCDGKKTDFFRFRYLEEPVRTGFDAITIPKPPSRYRMPKRSVEQFADSPSRGIFHSLDSAGVLNHRVSGVDNVERAVSEPPSSGRARIRGQAIHRLAAEGFLWRCDWQYILHCTDGRMLDLSNPFATQETWRTSRELEFDVRPGRLGILTYLDNLRRRA